MYVVIENMTDESVYVTDHYYISDTYFEGQEKIYYCSTPIYWNNISGHDRVDFINMLNPFEKMEVPIKKISIDYEKYHYVINNDGWIDKIYDGECDTISFRLFYTREPIRFCGYSYYAEGMIANGYYVSGNQEGDKIIFNIIEHEKIVD